MCVLDELTTIKEQIKSYLENFLLFEFKNKESIKDIIINNLNDVGYPIRSYLFRLTYDAGSIFTSRDIKIESGIELMQLSTLIIDDYFDGSDQRNLKKSLLIQVGEKKTVAIGNILYYLGYSLFITGMYDKKKKYHNRSIIMYNISKAFYDIYYGQFLDLQYSGANIISKDKYIQMITLTTANFIKTCLLAGALLWDAKNEFLLLLERIGYNIGIAYQIRDDIIDIIGSEDYTGKPKAIDIKQKRMRLPLIIAIKNSKKSEKQFIKEYLSDTNQPTAEDINNILNIINNSGSIEYSKNVVKKYTDQAALEIDKLKNLKNLKSQLLAICNLISTFQ